MFCKGAAMALDDLLATLERQNGTSGTSGVPADVPPKPAPTLGGTSGTCGTSENRQRKAQADPFAVWLIQHPDRQPAEVHFWPPATRAEVLAIYPAAINAEALPDHPAPRQSARQNAQESAEKSARKPAAPSCRTCRHLHRPGLSDGHCGGRDDLPPAYTAGHPLRRLPDDDGAGCATWEESR